MHTAVIYTDHLLKLHAFPVIYTRDLYKNTLFILSNTDNLQDFSFIFIVIYRTSFSLLFRVIQDIFLTFYVYTERLSHSLFRVIYTIF